MTPATLAALALLAVTLAMVIHRSKTTHFECPDCGFSFKLPTLSFILAPHTLYNKRYVTCPNCGHSGMMSAIKDN